MRAMTSAYCLGTLLALVLVSADESGNPPGAVCNGREYDAISHGCCGNKIFAKDSHLCCVGKVKKSKDGTTCCGKTTYKVGKELCCGGKKHKGGEGLACCKDETYRTDYEACGCGNEKDQFTVYGRRTHTCHLDGVIIKGQSLTEESCGGKPHYPERDLCCGRKAFPRAPTRQCCETGDQDYDVTKENCCWGKVLKGGPGLECCYNKAVYDPKTQTCCEKSTVIEGHEDDVSCCGSKGYNSETHLCCFESHFAKKKKVYRRNQDLCCRGKVYRDQVGMQCCGKKVYNQLTHVCCDRKKIRPATKGCSSHVKPIGGGGGYNYGYRG